MKVVLTRPPGDNDSLKALLPALDDLEVEEIPLISIRALAPDPRIASPARCDHLIFVSRNAVRFGLPALRECLGRTSPACYAAGEATARQLEEFGIVARSPAVPGSEGLLDLMRIDPGDAALIVRGKGGRELLGDELGRAGARVDYLEVYERRPVQLTASQRSRFEGALAVVYSGEALTHLAASLGTDCARIRVLTVSERIADIASRLPGGPADVYVAPGIEDQSVADSVANVIELISHE